MPAITEVEVEVEEEQHEDIPAPIPTLTSVGGAASVEGSEVQIASIPKQATE